MSALLGSRSRCSQPGAKARRDAANPPRANDDLVLKRPRVKTTLLEGARLLVPKKHGITEVRILEPGRGVTLAGYFDRAGTLAAALAARDGRLDHANIYVTLNPVKRALLSRAKNRLTRLRTLARDADIERRCWLPIDIDPVRPKGVSSTKAELKAARRKRDDVVAYLRGQGWSAPVLAVSGNGAHALFPLDLPNTSEITALIERALKTLDGKFSDDVAKVDTAVGNPSRVWKLYGSVARKGKATAARPHRRSYIETAPASLIPISRDHLHRLAEQASVRTGRLDMTEWPVLAAVRARGLFRATREPGHHCIKCPWAEDHSMDGGSAEAMLFEPSPENGNRGGFKCLHDHCAKRSIDDLIALIAPDSVHLLCMANIAPQAVHWLWLPWIPSEKVTLVEGDPGLGKSHLTLQLAAALSRGRGLPGMPRTAPANTLLLTAEDGLGDTVRPRLDAMGAELGHIFPLSGDLVFDAPGLALLEQAIQQTSARLVVVDPLVAYLGATVDLHRANETRAVMKQLAAIAERHHCAIVLVRHLTKSGKDHAIYRGLGSIDLTAACRSVMLVGCDPNDATRAALIHIKSNLAAKAASLGFTIADGVFKWTGPTTLTAADILGAEQGGQSAVQEAENFLRSALADGPVAVTAVQKQARVAGVAPKTLRRARESMRVIAKQVHEEGRKGAAAWTWSLPEADQSPAVEQTPTAEQAPTVEEGQVNSQTPSRGPKDGLEVHLPPPPSAPEEGK